MMKNKIHTRIEKFQKEMGMHYAIIPNEIAESFGEKFPIRVRAKINKEVQQCALMKSAGGYFFIYLQFDIRKKQMLQLGDMISIELVKDTSPFGFDMPEELDAVLEQDPEGKEKFLQLLPGKQRNIIYYIMTGKLVETRIQRSLSMIERVKSNEFGYKKNK